MPRDPKSRAEALDRLSELLTTRRCTSQADLARALAEAGHPMTQSAISRGLRELGVKKRGGCYALPGEDESAVQALPHSVRDAICRVSAAGPNLLVINTEEGLASRVALALDRGGWPECLGTVAGDDTLFVATPNAKARQKLAARLQPRPPGGAEPT